MRMRGTARQGEKVKWRVGRYAHKRGGRAQERGGKEKGREA